MLTGHFGVSHNSVGLSRSYDANLVLWLNGWSRREIVDIARTLVVGRLLEIHFASSFVALGSLDGEVPLVCTLA